VARDSRLWQDPQAVAVTYDGDPTAGAQWLGYAKATLKFMLSNSPGPLSATYTPTSDVTIRVDTRPNRIHITAGSIVHVAYPDWAQTSAALDPTIMPYQINSHHPIYKKDPPIDVVNHSIGGGYWVNSAKSSALSWRFNAIYYSGNSFELAGTKLNYRVLAACMSGGRLAAVSVDPSTVTSLSFQFNFLRGRRDKNTGFISGNLFEDSDIYNGSLTLKVYASTPIDLSEGISPTLLSTRTVDPYPTAVKQQVVFLGDARRLYILYLIGSTQKLVEVKFSADYSSEVVTEKYVNSLNTETAVTSAVYTGTALTTTGTATTVRSTEPMADGRAMIFSMFVDGNTIDAVFLTDVEYYGASPGAPATEAIVHTETIDAGTGFNVSSSMTLTVAVTRSGKLKVRTLKTTGFVDDPNAPVLTTSFADTINASEVGGAANGYAYSQVMVFTSNIFEFVNSKAKVYVVERYVGTSTFTTQSELFLPVTYTESMTVTEEIYRGAVMTTVLNYPKTDFRTLTKTLLSPEQSAMPQVISLPHPPPPNPPPTTLGPFNLGGIPNIPYSFDGKFAAIFTNAWYITMGGVVGGGISVIFAPVPELYVYSLQTKSITLIPAIPVPDRGRVVVYTPSVTVYR